jgi:glycerol-3-phosphate acyltransferase PlsY
MDDLIDYLGAYLIGSASVGVLVLKLYGRKGKAGAYWSGVLAALNLIKGALPVFIAHVLSASDPPDMVVAGFLAILGDRYPLYTKFKGTPNFWVIPGAFAAILYCMLAK